MYANPSLIVQAMYFTSKRQSLYYSTRGGFLKIFKWRFVFHVTIKIHYFFIVCRITFSQEDIQLQSFTEQYFIVNKWFWENRVNFKIQNLPIHLYSETVLHIWCLHCITALYLSPKLKTCIVFNPFLDLDFGTGVLEVLLIPGYFKLCIIYTVLYSASRRDPEIMQPQRLYCIHWINVTETDKI